MPATKKKYRLVEARFDYSYLVDDGGKVYPYPSTPELNEKMDVLVCSQLDCNAAIADAMGSPFQDVEDITGTASDEAMGKVASEEKIKAFVATLNEHRAQGSQEIKRTLGRYLQNSSGGHEKTALLQSDSTAAAPHEDWTFDIDLGDALTAVGYVSIYVRVTEVPLYVNGTT